MSLIIHRAAPKNRYRNVLLLVILFSLILIPLCAAEEKNITTPAPEGKTITAAAAEEKDTTAPAAEEETITPPATDDNYSISPATLAVYAVQGDTEERTILFLKSSPETGIEHIQVVPLPLTRTDNREVILASAIHPGTPVLLDPPNGLTIPVTFTFNTSVPGEYAGNFLINSNSSATLMPVTVKLKERPWLPALVLAFFTVFSVLFYDYATRGLKTDKLKVKINSITSRLPAEFPGDSPTSRYTRYFYGKISQPLAEAVGNLGQGDYDRAESDYKIAEAVWTNWILSRPQWAVRLEDSVKIEKTAWEIDTRVKKAWPKECPLEKTLPFIERCLARLDAVWEQAPGIDPATATSTTPETTRTRLDALHTTQRLFEGCFAQVQEIPVHNPDEVPGCIQKLRKMLRDYTFDDTEEKIREFVNSFTTECIACAREVNRSDLRISPVLLEFTSRQTPKTVAPEPGPEKELSAWQKFCQRVGDLWHGICQWVGRQWDGTRQWIWRNSPLSPSQKIRLYEILHSVFLPALILFIMGFTQLYYNNLTFGANGAGDYFTLVLWGFATGTASEPLAQLIKDRTPPP
jgi:hypothetical protein